MTSHQSTLSAASPLSPPCPTSTSATASSQPGFAHLPKAMLRAAAPDRSQRASSPPTLHAAPTPPSAPSIAAGSPRYGRFALPGVAGSPPGPGTGHTLSRRGDQALIGGQESRQDAPGAFACKADDPWHPEPHQCSGATSSTWRGYDPWPCTLPPHIGQVTSCATEYAQWIQISRNLRSGAQSNTMGISLTLSLGGNPREESESDRDGGLARPWSHPERAGSFAW